MPWVPFLQCAPAEKPWLISSVRDLLQDEEVKKEWEEKYKEEKFGWPGANSTYKEKLKWGNKIYEVINVRCKKKNTHTSQTIYFYENCLTNHFCFFPLK